MTDLVLVSLEAWDEVWRRNQHLVAGLLRCGHVDRVLFVEPPVDMLHDLRRRSRPHIARPTPQRIDLGGTSGELWKVRPRKLLPRRLDPTGDRRRARFVVKVARRLGMPRPVLWVNDPGGADILHVSGWPALYDITDDWLVAERSRVQTRRLRRWESALLEHCRQVVVCSQGLRSTRSALREVVLIPNAVDLEPYRTLQERPADLPPGPVVLYLGTAHRDRLDVDLCLAVARRVRAQEDPATLVLVGPAPLPEGDLRALKQAGVVLLGPRPSGSVPSYLQHAAVLVVPHVLTDFTASLDPIKAYEYRAARRWVVSTCVPGFTGLRDPLVRTADAADFPEAVVEALSSPRLWSPELPDDIPTWAERVSNMSGVIRRTAGDAA